MSTIPTPTIDDQTQRMIDDMIAAEARYLSQRATEEECDCKDGMFPSRAPANRRNFLFAAGSSAGAAAAALLAGSAAAQQAPAGAKHFDVPADPTKEQGRAVAADGGYGTRSQFETEVRVRFPTANENTSWSFTPLDKTLGQPHAVRPAFRAPSRRHPDHRSGETHAATCTAWSMGRANSRWPT